VLAPLNWVGSIQIRKEQAAQSTAAPSLSSWLLPSTACRAPARFRQGDVDHGRQVVRCPSEQEMIGPGADGPGIAGCLPPRWRAGADRWSVRRCVPRPASARPCRRRQGAWALPSPPTASPPGHIGLHHAFAGEFARVARRHAELQLNAVPSCCRC
jgi:hypothetical protein